MRELSITQKEMTMRSIFVIVSFVIGLLLFSPAAMAGDECENPDVCIATFGQPAAPKAPVENMVCVWFTQAQPGDVMIVLYATAPEENDQPGRDITFEKTRWHDAHSKYCFGKWRLTGVVWLMVCGERGYATRGIPAIDLLKEDGAIDVGYLG